LKNLHQRLWTALARLAAEVFEAFIKTEKTKEKSWTI